jgi:hypothetical protein
MRVECNTSNTSRHVSAHDDNRNSAFLMVIKHTSKSTEAVSKGMPDMHAL